MAERCTESNRSLIVTAIVPYPPTSQPSLRFIFNIAIINFLREYLALNWIFD